MGSEMCIRDRGIGWAQELLARLSKSKVNTAQITTQNTSYPLELNQKLNVDFTHDDIIVSVLSALNYTQVVGDYLSAKRANPKRTFVLSHIVPFAARLIFEVCKRTIKTNADTFHRSSHAMAGSIFAHC